MSRLETRSELDALRDRLAYDTPFFARQCLWIVNKSRKLQRLDPLPWQARTPETPAHVTPLDEALETQRLQNRPQRVIICKARKLGMSTWIQAKVLQRCTQLPFQNALTVCHRADATVDLADMASLMYDKLPDDRALTELVYGPTGTSRPPFSVKPGLLATGTSRNGIRFMEFGTKHRRSEHSIYRTMTAGAKGGGRAGTPNMVHASEYAHYEDPDYGVGLFNAMPLEPDTIGIIESTANGFNHFWKLWDMAVRGSEDETGVLWQPLFYGWHDNPRNALPFINEHARERFEHTIGDEDGGGDLEEPLLIETYGATLEQLNWRRALINGPEANGSIEWFHQEHPTTPEQAFVGSGRPVFPGILVARALREAATAPKPVEGVLRGVDWVERRTRAGTVNVPQLALWVPAGMMEPVDLDRWGPAHRLRVWRHPVNERTQAGLAWDQRRPDGQYVVFVDVAQGSGNAEEGDYSAIQVLDHITHTQVASYRSRVPVHDLPLIAYMIGVYYNDAWLAVEATGLGIGVVDALAKDYRYRMMYRRHRAGDDERTDARERVRGWYTDLRTKPLMEQTFGQALREGTHGIRCVPTARELNTYVIDPKNPAKHGAQAGAHDDLLMAFMGAHRVAAELVPRDPNRKRGARWHAADDVSGY
jgi:hypothetical protein